MFMVAGRLVVGSGRRGRVPDVVVARPTSATGGRHHQRAGRPAPRTGAGARCRTGGPVRVVVDGGRGRWRRPPPEKHGRAWPGSPTGTRTASGGLGAGPGHTGPCRSGNALQWS